MRGQRTLVLSLWYYEHVVSLACYNEHSSAMLGLLCLCDAVMVDLGAQQHMKLNFAYVHHIYSRYRESTQHEHLFCKQNA